MGAKASVALVLVTLGLFGPISAAWAKKDKVEVTLTAPAAGALYSAPAAVVLSAIAQTKQKNHPIAKVEFFQGTSLVGSVTGPQAGDQYTLSWTGVASGIYALTARVTDNLAGAMTSLAVNVTVNTAEAKLYYIHVDHLNTPRLIADEQQRTVWRWDQAEPFGVNPPDENPSGLGVFEFPLRFPGQYADRETGWSQNG